MTGLNKYIHIKFSFIYLFLVSRDDEQMWTLFPPHHLFKLDRLTVPFEK